MRPALDHRHTRSVEFRLPEPALDHGAQRPVGRRHHRAQRRRAPLQPADRLQKRQPELRHFGAAAARQHGDRRCIQRHTKPRARRGRVRLRGERRRQRMADVGRAHPGVREQFFLEWKNEQEVIDRALDQRDAPGPPRPDGGGHELHGAQPRRAQARLDAEIEVRRIHADEHVGPPAERALDQRAPQRQQPRQVAQDFRVAAHRQFAHVPPRVEAGRRHAFAADARIHPADDAFAQRRQHRRGEQIARGLARHHRDTRAHAHALQRTMPRVDSRTNSASRRRCGACSGASAACARSCSTAAAAVSPSRYSVL